MSYIATSDSHDVMIIITSDDVTAADNYVNALLTRLGVTLPLTTVPYEVKQLALAVAHRGRALWLSGPGGGMGEQDAYMAKYKAYDKEVNRWEPLITPELINGTTQFECSVELGRA